LRTDILEAILERRSIRTFRPEPIPEKLLTQILEAARWSPSAGNCQARDIIVVKDLGIRRQLSEAALGQDFIEKAPINLVVCASPERSAWRYGDRGRNLHCILDAAASIENILLATHALGLGACWVGAFHDSLVSQILKLPRSMRPLAIIPVGYPDEKPSPTPRMVLGDFVHFEAYGSRYRGDR